MTSTDEPVLAACFNQAYLPHVAALLRSVATSTLRPTRWYLVGDESVEPAALRQLLDFARSCGMNAEPLRISEALVAPFEDVERYPRAVWYRTVLAEALPHERRLVYLDSDVLVLHDLQALWQTQLAEGHFFAALAHPSYGDTGMINTERLGLPHAAPYFNSGVMVMDLELMRSKGFRERTVEFVLSGGRPALVFPEQDAMNVVFADEWTPLDPRWNCLTTILLPFILGASWADDRHHDPVALERAARSPAIVHFEGPSLLKPWHRRCFNPFAHLYREYRAMTPWPLLKLDGRRRDAVLSRMPPRLQATVWRTRLWRSQAEAGIGARPRTRLTAEERSQSRA